MANVTWSDHLRIEGDENPGGPEVAPSPIALTEGLREEIVLNIAPPPGDSRAMRVIVDPPWLQVSPMDLPAGGGQVTLRLVPDQVGAMEMASGRLETTLRVEMIPTRALRSAPRVPRTMVPVAVELKAVAAPENLIATEPPVSDPEPPVVVMEPPAPVEVEEAIAILPSATELNLASVPADTTVTRILTFTWLRGTPGLLTITRDASWLQIQPTRLDFRNGKLAQDVTVRLLGKELPAHSEAEGHIIYAAGEMSDFVTVRAVREDDDAVRGRASRLRAAATATALGMYVLYLLVLLFRWHFPPGAVGLPALAVVALGAGAMTWRNTGSAHAFWWGVGAGVATLVIAVTRDTFVARDLALVVVPAVGIPAVWMLAGAGFYRNPSASYLVPAIPVTVALGMTAILTGLLQVSPQAPRGIARQGGGAQEVRTAETAVGGAGPSSPASARQTGSVPTGTVPAARRTPEAGAASEPAAVAPPAPVDPVPVSQGALRKYLRTHPNNVKALNRLAEFELASGSTERALSLWKKSLSCDPGQAGVAQKIAELESRR
jgi:hypothetical protein